MQKNGSRGDLHVDNHSGQVLQDLGGRYVRVDIDLINPKLPQGVEMVAHVVIRMVIAAVIFPRGKKAKEVLFRRKEKLPVKPGGEHSRQVAGQGKPAFDTRGLPQPPEVADGSFKPAFNQGTDLLRVGMEPGQEVGNPA